MTANDLEMGQEFMCLDENKKVIFSGFRVQGDSLEYPALAAWNCLQPYAMWYVKPEQVVYV